MKEQMKRNSKIIKWKEIKQMEKVISIIKSVEGENLNIDDMIYNIYFQMELMKSQEDIENGRVMTVAEAKERMRQKYENINI